MPMRGNFRAVGTTDTQDKGRPVGVGIAVHRCEVTTLDDGRPLQIAEMNYFVGLGGRILFLAERWRDCAAGESCRQGANTCPLILFHEILRLVGPANAGKIAHPRVEGKRGDPGMVPGREGRPRPAKKEKAGAVCGACSKRRRMLGTGLS